MSKLVVYRSGDPIKVGDRVNADKADSIFVGLEGEVCSVKNERYVCVRIFGVKWWLASWELERIADA